MNQTNKTCDVASRIDLVFRDQSQLLLSRDRIAAWERQDYCGSPMAFASERNGWIAGRGSLKCDSRSQDECGWQPCHADIAFNNLLSRQPG